MSIAVKIWKCIKKGRGVYILNKRGGECNSSIFEERGV